MSTHSSKSKQRYASGERYSEVATLKKRQVNCKKWIEKSSAKYSDIFDYSKAKTQYKTQKEPEVEILCKVHKHKFSIIPDKHVQYKFGGCEHCEREAVQAQFLEKSSKSFMDWFERERSDWLEIVGDFMGMKVRLDFYCRIHETIEDFSPDAMMNGPGYGWGCSSCAKHSIITKNRLDAFEVRNELQLQLPDGIVIKNVYFDEEAKGTKIITECQEHGQQLPVSKAAFKKSSTKCQNCSQLLVGYTGKRLKTLISQNSPGRSSCVAVMKMNVFGIDALKVGFTTRSLEQRYRENLKLIYFEVNLFERDAIVLENRIKTKFHNQRDEKILKAGVRYGKRWSGDTEFFQPECKEAIIQLIASFVKELQKNEINYETELGGMIIPNSLPRRSEFNAGIFQTAIPIIGIDTKTNEILYELNSYNEAEEMGFDNIATIVSEKYGKSSSRGVRWFKKSEFDPNNIPVLEIQGSKAVFCVERNQHFRSTRLAEEYLRDLGFKINASKITGVVTGRREKAAGMRWEYSKLSTKEILNQNIDKIIDFKPFKASNDKTPIKLVSKNNANATQSFGSISLAAKAIGSTGGNLSRALTTGGTCKGYYVFKLKNG